MKPPCLGCPDRWAECHSHCEKYKEFRKILDKENAERSKRIKAHLIQNDIEKDRIIKASEGRFYRSRRRNNGL